MHSPRPRPGHLLALALPLALTLGAPVLALDSPAKGRRLVVRGSLPAKPLRLEVSGQRPQAALQAVANLLGLGGAVVDHRIAAKEISVSVDAPHPAPVLEAIAEAAGGYVLVEEGLIELYPEDRPLPPEADPGLRAEPGLDSPLRVKAERQTLVSLLQTVAALTGLRCASVDGHLQLWLLDLKVRQVPAWRVLLTLARMTRTRLLVGDGVVELLRPEVMQWDDGGATLGADPRWSKPVRLRAHLQTLQSIVGTLSALVGGDPVLVEPFERLRKVSLNARDLPAGHVLRILARKVGLQVREAAGKLILGRPQRAWPPPGQVGGTVPRR